MADDGAPFFKLDLAERGSFTFQNPSELQTWIQEEKSALMRFVSGGGHTSQKARAQLSHLWNPVEAQLNQFQQAAARNQDTKARLDSLVNTIRTLYRQQPSLPLSDSALVQHLQALAKDRPDVAAAMVGIQLGAKFQSNDPDIHRGAVELALFEKGFGIQTAQAGRKAIEAFLVTGRRRIGAFKGQLTKLEKHNENLEQQSGELLQRETDSHQKLREEHGEQLQQLLTETRQALKTHEDTYHEKLALHSAVTYWTNREKLRKREALLTACLFALGLAAAAAILFYFVDHLLIGELSPQKVAGVLLTASPVFWALRVLARLLLSQLHLATDASERAILIQTYLALHKENKIDDKQREFLLATVFRPSTTGIVRDDAAPGWSDLAAGFLKK